MKTAQQLADRAAWILENLGIEAFDRLIEESKAAHEKRLKQKERSNGK